MTMRFRIIPIHLSEHFIDRWNERVGQDNPREIVKILRKAIESEVKKGAEVRYGVLKTPILTDVYSYVAPSLQGGWEAITVIVEAKDEDSHYRKSRYREEHTSQGVVGEIETTND